MIFEDSPEWDCATMGNFICGAGAHSHTQGYIEVTTDFTPVNERYADEAWQASVPVSVMPDTSIPAPEGTPLDAIVFILALVLVSLLGREHEA